MSESHENAKEVKAMQSQVTGYQPRPVPKLGPAGIDERATP